jgi:hypothetical protein
MEIKEGPCTGITIIEKVLLLKSEEIPDLIGNLYATVRN